jgi:hypothetical protein
MASLQTAPVTITIAWWQHQQRNMLALPPTSQSRLAWLGGSINRKQAGAATTATLAPATAAVTVVEWLGFAWWQHQ